MRNKNKLWQRYSRGEKLNPTYNSPQIKTNLIIPGSPPEPQQPKKITYGGLGLLDKIISVIVAAIIAFAIYLTFFHTPK